MRKIIGCCLIAVSLLSCTACSGLNRLNENLKDGAEQLSDDVVIGISNALITPYQSFEGSRGHYFLLYSNTIKTTPQNSTITEPIRNGHNP